MDDGDTTEKLGSLAAGSTDEYPTVAGAPVVGGGLDETPFGDGDDEWPDRGPAKGIRLAVPTALLLAAVLVGAGFWGGAALQKSHGSSSPSAGAGAGFLARLRAAAGAAGGTGTAGGAGSGAGGFGLAPSAAALGTISLVDGRVLYVLTTSGALVKVTLGPSTSITRNAKSTAVGLRPGDAVVVQGATAANGDVSASSVAATAPGAGSTGGLGGRFGGLGGASGGASRGG
jgi:hypothetical protein